ncbi:MAG: hypothetical protein U5L96_22355 [Owenweeksia sp.]|nr:hypothetical protein [Owenweeksia sp.]
MQKYLPLATLLLLGACQPNSPRHTAKGLVSQEVFTTSLGEVQVYGIAIKATATSNSQRGFAISFSVNDKTWLDTLHPDLNPGRHLGK